MVVKKSKFYCEKCRIWSFWNYENHGKCTICFPKKKDEKLEKKVNKK